MSILYQKQRLVAVLIAHRGYLKLLNVQTVQTARETHTAPCCSAHDLKSHSKVPNKLNKHGLSHKTAGISAKHDLPPEIHPTNSLHGGQGLLNKVGCLVGPFLLLKRSKEKLPRMKTHIERYP